MNLVAIILVAMLVGVLIGLWLARRAPTGSVLPPVGSHDTDPFVAQDSPNYPDSAGYKRGA